MATRVLIFIFISLTCLTSSCKKCKDCDPGNTDSGRIALLVNNWKISRVSQSGQTIPLYQNPLPAGQSITEDYSRYRLSFINNTDYQIIEKDGITRLSGKWELSSNGDKIILNKGTTSDERVLDISNLTENLLHVRYMESNSKTGNRELLVEFIPE